MLEVKGREFGIKGVCARNKEKKLLKLKIDGKGFKRAKFAKKIKEGQEVFIMLPEGEPVRGKIIAIKDRIRIEVNAQVPKIRGLPVFNKDEEVLGIVEFFIKDKNDVYAIPVLEGISFKNTGLLSINGWKQMRTKEWMESDIGKRQIIIYLMGMEKYEEAAVRLEKLIKAHPDDKEAYFRLGVCYGKRGEYQKAKDAYEKYTSLVPDDLKGHYNLGIAYLGTGDIQAAKREYEFLKRIGSKEAAAFSERLLEYIEKEEKP
ncbi:MAG: tetratricopeptide repeat protein [bacterium]